MIEVFLERVVRHWVVLAIKCSVSFTETNRVGKEDLSFNKITGDDQKSQHEVHKLFLIGP